MSDHIKNWIVISGQPIDTVDGGGFEFFGPFTKDEAKWVRKQQLSQYYPPGNWISIAVQLLDYPALTRMKQYEPEDQS